MLLRSPRTFPGEGYRGRWAGWKRETAKGTSFRRERKQRQWVVPGVRRVGPKSTSSGRGPVCPGKGSGPTRPSSPVGYRVCSPTKQPFPDTHESRGPGPILVFTSGPGVVGRPDVSHSYLGPKEVRPSVTCLHSSRWSPKGRSCTPSEGEPEV